MLLQRRKLTSLMLLWFLVVLLLMALLLSVQATGDDKDEQNEALSRKILQYCLGPNDDNPQIIQDILDSADAAENKDIIDINIRDPNSGQTPLMASVLRGKPQLVETLLKAGADATIPEKDGYTPPHGAAFQGRTEVMKILVKYGVINPEEDDDEDYFHNGDGYLPFHRACWGRTPRHAELVEYMLEAKLVQDPNIKSRNGKTCRQMTHNEGIIEILDKYEAAANKQQADEL